MQIQSPVKVIAAIILALTLTIAGVLVYLSSIGGLEADPAKLSFTFSSFPAIDSSTSNQHIVYKAFCELTGYTCVESEFGGEKFVYLDYEDLEEIGYERFEQKVLTSKTHGAYVNLINGDVDLILVASSPSDEELELAAAAGVEFELTPIAKDAFIFMKHSDNPVVDLSLTEIREVYSGIVEGWGELGWDDGGAISAYVRNPNSGSQETMKALVMEGEELIELQELIIPTMIGLVSGLSDDPSGIGYSFYYYKGAMTQVPNVEFFSVDGIEPNKDTIANGSYPLTTEVYLVTRQGDVSQEALLLKEWLLSAPGQELIEDVGYVGL